MAFSEIMQMLQEEFQAVVFENYNLKQQLMTAQAALKFHDLKTGEPLKNGEPSNNDEPLQNGEFKELDTKDNNVTRTGKTTDDLDVSDRTAMGYVNTTTKAVTQAGDETEDIGPEDSTLVDSDTNSNDKEDPGAQKQTRVSFCENLVIHNGSREENGITKTEDGGQTLHKSLLVQNSALKNCETFMEEANTGADDTKERLSKTPQFWANPDESFQRKVKMNEERIEPPLSPHESWNEEVAIKDPSLHNIIDLSSKKWNLVDYAYMKMPTEDCLPQSVAVDRARMYVADPYNCKIHLYEMGNYLGDFILNTFNVPRYVLCVPSSPQIIPGLDPNQYQDILVMDEDHIKLLDASGNIKNELFDSQIRKFRGLTYANLDGKNTIITTEKTRHAIKLVFIQLDNLEVLRKMDINKNGIYGPIEFEAAKCMFIKATSNHIYVTDLGNGCVLDTDTKLWVTKKLNLPKGRKLMGVEVDPSENFIVATSHDQDREWNCNLEVFNPKGSHQRTMELRDVIPSGIYLMDGLFYLADVLNKQIMCFNITDN